jgi:hypothetical protein
VSPSDRRRQGAAARANDATADEDLPYTVELWTFDRTEVERVLGRASSATLAQAIFAAAQNEHLGRRITLYKGDELIAESR